MKKIYLLLISFVFSILFTAVQAQTIHYVKENGAGTKDGTSWTNASGDIQEMINGAAANDQIWVAKGTYKPNRPLNNLGTIDANNVNNAFVLKTDVKLYGGFIGTESVLLDRSLNVNTTTLSGDFNGDDTVTGSGNTLSIGNNIENARHVLLSVGNVGTACLDGFTIIGARARYDGGGTNAYVINGVFVNQESGGGMHISNSSPIIINCTFTKNDGDESAGIHVTDSSPNITNCIIIRNTASNITGGIGMVRSSTSIRNTILTENYAANRGGALSSLSSSTVSLINCTIYNNFSANGSGFYVYNSTTTLYNTIYFGTVFKLGGDLPVLKNSLGEGILYDVSGNITTTTTTVANLFKDPTNGDYSLKTGSIAINTGNNTFYTDAGGSLTLDKDVAGNKRVFQNTIDIGVYESQIPILIPDANNIVYVNKTATGTATGTSWENATTEVAYALVWANINKANFTTTPLQIWAAGGTYKPLYSPEDGTNFGTNQNRLNTFLMVKNVQIFGGFAGTETILTDRNLSLTTNKTTLSGDFGTADVVTGSGESLSITENDSNAAHVILSAGDVGTALVDGFTIRGGNANLSSTTLTVNGISTLLYYGGGMLNQSSSPKINNINFIANTADYGGGMFNQLSSPTISNSTFVRNYSSGMINDDASPIIANTSFIDNNGSDGGGIANFYSSPTITNSIFNNNAASRGGAVFNYDNSSATIINTTFINNIGGVGYGGAMQNDSSNPKIYNSIVWGDIRNNSSTPEIKNSLIEGSNDLTNGNIDATNLLSKDIFNDPTNGDYSLNGFGPALNAGDNTLYTGTTATDKDLAGKARLFAGIPDPDAIDMGAYEYQAEPLKITATNGILYVNKTATGNKTGDSWTNAIPQLADALVWAHNNKTDFTTIPLQIWVAGGTYKPLYSPEDGTNFGTNQSRNNTFLMVKNVQVYGGFTGTETALVERNLSLTVNATTLSGDIGTVDDNTDNTYHVLVSAGDMGTARLDGFTITGGYANSTDTYKVNTKDAYSCSGAGIYNSESNPKYINLTIKENSCTESGGGMFSYKSTPNLQNVSIENNQAKDGGGMANQDTSFATLLNVAIKNNNASLYGSGLYNVDQSNATLINSSIVGNKATINSESVVVPVGCASQNSSVTLKNSIVWDEITGDFTAQYSLIKNKSNTGDGNIDATGLTDTTIFNDPANGDYTLKSTSPAVNAGDNSLYTGILATDKDLSGNTRLYDGFPTVDKIDIGAYESQKNPFMPTIALSASSIDENVAADTEIGTLSSTDVGSNAFTYALVSGTDNTDNSAFTISGKSLKINASPDFETKSSYAVRIVTSDGISTFEKDFTITINDLCEIDNTVTQNLGILTANTTGASYKWYDCLDDSVVGTNSNTFSPTKDGEYKVVITVGSCAVTSACIVFAKLGTTPFESNSELLIYPNPASNVINIQSDVTGNFIILNQLGQTMKTIPVDSDSIQKIDVSFLADGIYFIKENNNTQAKAKKIILKK
ncbi:beta strand repeat-containing protein [Flavobacterium sp.]|uniref:beta strand repeat-containing protein n=1 Tax=Flavobacterium sp. TaxID=239 RepID=UPI003C3ECC3E